MSYSADQVWGLAVRADTLNGGYFKEDQWKNDHKLGLHVSHTANKRLVKQWLIDNTQPTESEVEQGREYRRFFNSYTLKALMGELSGFDRQALHIAQMDRFESRDLMEIALASCLPSVSRREQSRTEFKREAFTSTQISGQPGESIAGIARIVSCNWSQNYGRYRVVAQIEESFVDFWTTHKLKGTVKVRAKIKQQRADNTTQLNYVKVDTATI